MAYGGIDFAPQPAPGSNPFEPVAQGINLGFGIQQQMREQQKFQADQLAAQAAAQAAKDKAEMERGEKGLAYLKEFGKDLSPETKTKVIRESVIPLANKMYGLNIDPSTIDYKDDYANLLKLMSNKAPAELIKEEYALLVSRADKESLPVIKELGDTLGLGEKKGIARQTGRVTKDGLPVAFVPGMGYAYNDPATGEYTPYNEPTFAPSGNPSAGAETRLSEIYQQRFIVDEALDLLSPEAVGLLDRAYKNVGAYMDESSDPAALQFKSLTEMANTVIRNGYYGATLTNNEKKAFEDIALNRNLSPTAYLAKAKGLQTSFKKMEKGIRMAAQAANRPFRDGGSSTASPASEIESMSDEELKRIIEGK